MPGFATASRESMGRLRPFEQRLEPAMIGVRAPEDSPGLDRCAHRNPSPCPVGLETITLGEPEHGRAIVPPKPRSRSKAVIS